MSQGQGLPGSRHCAAGRRTHAHLLGGERDDLLLHKGLHAGQALRQPVHARRHAGQAPAEGGARDVHEVRQAPAPEHAQVDVPDARRAHRVQQHRALPAHCQQERSSAKTPPRAPCSAKLYTSRAVTLCWRPWRWSRPAACAHPWTAAPPAGVSRARHSVCMHMRRGGQCSHRHLTSLYKLSSSLLLAGCSVPAGHVPQLPAHEQGPDSAGDIHTVVIRCGPASTYEGACLHTDTLI